jgi:hypothetical protein
MLDYTLETNELTANPGDYRAQVVNVTSYSQPDIVDRIMRIGAGLTRSDVAAVLEAEKQVVQDIIAEGCAVTTELFNAFPSIQGVFSGPEEAMDSSRHKVRIHLHPGSALRAVVGGIKTRKVAVQTGGIHFGSVTDIKSGSVNNVITPERNLKISGARLKIAGDDPETGLYFVPLEGGGAPVKTESSDIVINNPSEIISVIPPLPAGTYRLRLVTQYTGGSILKRPASADFDKILTVN